MNRGMILEKVVVGSMQANCYILGCARTTEAVVIDPGAEPEKIKAILKNLGLRVSFVVNTHGHVDHIGANAQLSAPVYIHRLDAEFLKDSNLSLSGMLGSSLELPKQVLLLEHGQQLKFGDISLQTIHTPGHTPGGVCFRTTKYCFTGDTLFAQGIGRCDFPYANEEALLNSIRERLFTLGDEVVIYPGHGPSSTIGKERRGNPFL